MPDAGQKGYWMDKYVCIHGHFYQPPRENPWLEYVELQDSAYPYHDWNARITEECYRQNAASRILGPDKKIIEIVNNYESISFDFGPTLMYWLESHAPDVYEMVLEADRRSREKFSGHGCAMAQAYNHMVMPLANANDKADAGRSGASRISRCGSRGSRKGCGCPRRRWICLRWKCWPRTGSSSPSWRRARPSGSGGSRASAAGGM